MCYILCSEKYAYVVTYTHIYKYICIYLWIYLHKHKFTKSSYYLNIRAFLFGLSKTQFHL